MTAAIFDQDHDALAKIFTDDLEFHLRGPAPVAGDHAGRRRAARGGRFAVRDDRRPDRARPAVLHRRPMAGRPSGSTPPSAATATTLESKNAFVYRFEGGRIAEMWMYLGALPDEAEAFFA